LQTGPPFLVWRAGFGGSAHTALGTAVLLLMPYLLWIPVSALFPGRINGSTAVNICSVSIDGAERWLLVP
jgi:tryptophan-rich sensory protein